MLNALLWTVTGIATGETLIVAALLIVKRRSTVRSVAPNRH